MKKIAIWIVLIGILTACGAGEPSVNDSLKSTATVGPALHSVTRAADASTDKETRDPAIETTETAVFIQATPSDELFQVMSQEELDAAGVVLVYQRIGGLKGIGPGKYEWTFYADGTIKSSDNRSWEVPPEDIANLVDSISNLGFSDLAESYVPADVCCDRAYHVITLNSDAQAHTVITLDAAEMPDNLTTTLDTINEYLTALSESS